MTWRQIPVKGNSNNMAAGSALDEQRRDLLREKYGKELSSAQCWHQEDMIMKDLDKEESFWERIKDNKLGTLVTNNLKDNDTFRYLLKRLLEVTD